MAQDDSSGRHLENEQYHLGRESWFTEGTQRPAHAEDDGPQRTVHEPARETPVHEETDVLVVGGGPAGCAAAVAAARLGAKVTLVERYNHLGGLSTGGLVIWIDRMSDWSGKQVITGFASEILDRLPAGAVAGAPPEQWGSTDPEQVAHWRERLSAFREVVTWSPMIDPEWLKYESVELLREAGVGLLLHSWVVDVLAEGRELRGAIF
jgi:NADPH-dependent 2,4-dienoyl-CoA reductase/sulfur reductase-like enzyme